MEQKTNMTKKIKAITAKDNIYWEGSDGREENPIFEKGVTYPIYNHWAGKVYFKNNYDCEHRWNIDKLEDFFIIEYESEDKSLCTFTQSKPVIPKRPLENWIQTITTKKFERCVEECTELDEGIFYNEDTNCVYLHYNPMKGYTVNDDSGFPTRINFTHKPEAFKQMLNIIEVQKVWREAFANKNRPIWEESIDNLKESVKEVNSLVKSDGGSTSYYHLKTIVSKDSIKELTNGNFEVSLETGDVIDILVGGNFDLGNATKALRRIYQASLGKGKEGIDMNYDANKINYFVKDFIRKVELKDDQQNNR